MQNKTNTKKWFSATGAKRGVLASIFFLSVWLAWAYGYTQGLTSVDQVNHSAGEILFFCDGKKTIEEITAILENKFSTANLLSQVQDFLDYALDKGWVCESCDD